FLIVSVVAGATGGVAPIAFRRSIIARRESALPSTSTWTGKPSMLAVTVKCAAGGGCFDSMGVTLLGLFVIRSVLSCGYSSTNNVDISLLTYLSQENVDRRMKTFC